MKRKMMIIVIVLFFGVMLVGSTIAGILLTVSPAQVNTTKLIQQGNEIMDSLENRECFVIVVNGEPVGIEIYDEMKQEIEKKAKESGIEQIIEFNKLPLVLEWLIVNCLVYESDDGIPPSVYNASLSTGKTLDREKLQGMEFSFRYDEVKQTDRVFQQGNFTDILFTIQSIEKTADFLQVSERDIVIEIWKSTFFNLDEWCTKQGIVVHSDVGGGGIYNCTFFSDNYIFEPYPNQFVVRYEKFLDNYCFEEQGTHSEGDYDFRCHLGEKLVFVTDE